MTMNEDMYYKKTVVYSTWKQRLQFRTSQELFSSHTVDNGTRLLLRTIIEGGYVGMRNILDVGCGYGAIGITLKKILKDCSVSMVDRDALAIEYSRQNSTLNGLEDVDIYGSLGYEDVKRNDFDLIAANLPGKAGEPVIVNLLQEAGYFLVPGGTVAIVVVTPLEAIVEKILKSTSGVEITLKRTRPGHAVFHYRFTGKYDKPGPRRTALEREVYQRKSLEFRSDNLRFPIKTAYGLPDFDSLNHRREMLIKALDNMQGIYIRNTVVVNPAQGHIAIALWKILNPESMALVDRDLLALRYSEMNLIMNGCPGSKVSILHQVGINVKREGKIDLFLGVLREEEGQRANLLTITQAIEQLNDNGTIIVSASSTAITRLVTQIQSQDICHIRLRERWKGNSLLVLARSQ